MFQKNKICQERSRQHDICAHKSTQNASSLSTLIFFVFTFVQHHNVCLIKLHMSCRCLLLGCLYISLPVVSFGLCNILRVCDSNDNRLNKTLPRMSPPPLLFRLVSYLMRMAITYLRSSNISCVFLIHSGQNNLTTSCFATTLHDCAMSLSFLSNGS